MDDLFQDGGGSKSVDYTELAHRFLYRAKIVLKRYWWVLPVAVALGIAYKVVEGYLADPYYRSSARMIVTGRIALPDNEVYTEERDNFFGTQLELMNSGRVKSKAVERVKLTHPELHEAFTKTEAYRKHGLQTLVLEADVKDETSIFALRAYGPHREYTRVYLDAVMEAYINRRSEMRSKTSEKTYEAVAKQLAELEKEIDKHEDAIVEFQENNNIVFIQEQGSSAGAYLAELKRSLAELKTESRALSRIARTESVDTLLLDRARDGADGGGAADDGAGGGTPGDLVDAVSTPEDSEKYRSSKQKLEQLRAELEEFSIYLKPRHPKIIDLKDRIERTENQLAIQRRQVLDRIRERKETVGNKIANLKEEIAIWEETALENGRLIAEFERLQSRLERAKAAYERNQEALRAIESNQSVQQEAVSVLEEASPASPAGSGMARRVMEGGLYGVVAAGGVLFLLGSLDNRILTANELSGLFEEPLLGAIPFEENKKNDGDAVLLRHNDDRYVFAEACRNLRTSVFFMGSETFKPSVFAVTSAAPSEGKSTVSANLAVALSFSRSKVLLVDADLRRGHLHKQFGLNSPNGLADILQDRTEPDCAVQSTAYEHLDFISVGDYPEHPAELLMSGRIDTFLEWAKMHYDFVVFDTAPILATDDTTSFAGKVDAVLFTIRCAFTQVRQIKPAMGRLRERGVPISGIVLNYVDTSQPGYYYYRYSEYYTDPSKTTPDTGVKAAAEDRRKAGTV